MDAPPAYVREIQQAPDGAGYAEQWESSGSGAESGGYALTIEEMDRRRRQAEEKQIADRRAGVLLSILVSAALALVRKAWAEGKRQ